MFDHLYCFALIIIFSSYCILQSESYEYYNFDKECSIVHEVVIINTTASGANSAGVIEFKKLPYNGIVGPNCTIILNPPGPNYGLILNVNNVSLRWKDAHSCIENLMIAEKSNDQLLPRTKLNDCTTYRLMSFQYVGSWKIHFNARNAARLEDGSGFRLTYTTYKDEICWGPGSSSDAFKCVNGPCIDKALVCDQVNNCGDESDEFGCQSGIGSLTPTIAAVVSIIIVVAILSIIHVRRSFNLRRAMATTTAPYDVLPLPPYGEKGTAMEFSQQNYGMHDPPPPYSSRNN